MDFNTKNQHEESLRLPTSTGGIVKLRPCASLSRPVAGQLVVPFATAGSAGDRPTAPSAQSSSVAMAQQGVLLIE